MDITTIGFDLAKTVFQVHGADGEGRPVLRRKLRRGKVLAFFAGLPSCCQWRSKKGPPRRCKKGPLGGCGLVPVVHGRAPRATRRALNRLTRRRAREGPVGPRGQAWVGWSVHSAGGVSTPAALVEPVAVAVHLEDVDVVGEAVEERPVRRSRRAPVRRSRRAPVRRSEPNTSVHSSKGRLVVTRVEPRS